MVGYLKKYAIHIESSWDCFEMISGIMRVPGKLQSGFVKFRNAEKFCLAKFCIVIQVDAQFSKIEK